MAEREEAFDLFEAPRAAGEVLTLSFESWEGPLDLLLNLARSQKVDLKQISILALVEQYLRFIAEAKALKLELAADYLVMAAWLAYLKSALLLPRAMQEEPSPEEMALRLHLRLQRLSAMRDAGVSIESVIQRGAHEDGSVLLVVVTHDSSESAIAETLRTLSGSDNLLAEPVVMPILD